MEANFHENFIKIVVPAQCKHYIKLVSKKDQNTYQLNKNNASGFSALPGGCRDSDGGFHSQSSYGVWWTDTEYDVIGACDLDLSYGGERLGGGGSYES